MAATVIQTPHVMIGQYRKVLMQVSAELEATISEIKRVAGKLEDDILVGRAGSAMTESLNEGLAPQVQKFMDDMNKEIADLAKHCEENIRVDTGAAQQMVTEG